MVTGEDGGAALPKCDEPVTYVVVVHGMGKQRKNETTIPVVNRFAEARRFAGARREAAEKDRRDVLTLGAVSRQTGTTKDPGCLAADEQPWMEFEGIPRTSQCARGPFMGQASFTGENLRFVDMCWSDVLRTAHKEAGQPVEVWARGLLGRLLRKHEAAEKSQNRCSMVPFWVRRTLYLLVDGLLLTRKVMRFRFKKMEDLVFTKYLGDVQAYGEYGRCRGRAVRRFHDMMERIEKKHWEKENGTCRKPRYVVIAHSLGSVMSFDALMYASARENVRKGNVRSWEFPGYLKSSNKGTEETPCTDWIGRVASFVTLGSPIDKYLMIWWMNYRYLCTDKHLKNTDGAGHCRIRHFNYCDELDPAGHHLEVVSETVAYKAIFDKREDIVFNRYDVPGVAHNEYWADQELWRWILARSVDKPPGGATAPKWFERSKYRRLLLWLYGLVPAAVVGFGYVALTLAMTASSWQTAVFYAAAFAVVLYLGRRLVDLAVWWRQVQREEGEAARKNREEEETKNARKTAARRFRRWAAALPFAFGLLGAAGVWLTKEADWIRVLGGDPSKPDWKDVLEGGTSMGVLVAIVALGMLLFISRKRLPTAYRTPASGEDGRGSAECVAGWFGVVPPVLGLVAGIGSPWPAPELCDSVRYGVANLSILMVLASTVWAYRWRRFQIVKTRLRCERGDVCYAKYAEYSILNDLHVKQMPMVQGIPERCDSDRAANGEGLQLTTALDRSDARYRHGDSLSFSVETTEDAYVWVFDTGTSGKVRQIFPNQREQDNFVKAGGPVTIPRPGAGYEFVVSEPAGAVLLTVIASKDDTPLIGEPADPVTDTEPFVALRGTAASVVKELVVSLERHPCWVRDQKVFYVE